MNKETLAIDACGEPQASVFVIVVGSVFHALADTRTTPRCVSWCHRHSMLPFDPAPTARAA